MNPELLAFATAARECAMQMMANATYIKNHLHEVTIPAEIVPRIEAACESLVGTKHDIIHEVFELEESDAFHKTAERINRIIQWLFEPVEELHAIVQSLQFAAIQDHRHSTAALLVMESALNVINAFNAAGEAADAWTKTNSRQASHAGA